MKTLLLALICLLPHTFAQAAEAEPQLIQDAGLEYNLLTFQFLECDNAGTAGGVGMLFGAPRQELLESLARVKKTEIKEWDKDYGPFKTYREYVEATDALKEAFVHFLNQSGFGVLKTLPASGKLPEVTRDMLKDPWTLHFRDTYLNPLVHQFAKEMGWKHYTTMMFGGFEAQSKECKDEKGNFVPKRQIKEMRF